MRSTTSSRTQVRLRQARAREGSRRHDASRGYGLLVRRGHESSPGLASVLRPEGDPHVKDLVAALAECVLERADVRHDLSIASYRCARRSCRPRDSATRPIQPSRWASMYCMSIVMSATSPSAIRAARDGERDRRTGRASHPSLTQTSAPETDGVGMGDVAGFTKTRLTRMQTRPRIIAGPTLSCRKPTPSATPITGTT